MTYKYIRKMRGAGGWNGVRVVHLVREDGKTSKCGAVKDGEGDYEIIERSTKALTSLTCVNCLTMKLY